MPIYIDPPFEVVVRKTIPRSTHHLVENFPLHNLNRRVSAELPRERAGERMREREMGRKSERVRGRGGERERERKKTRGR